MVTVCCHVSCRCRHVTLVAGLYLAAEDMLWHVVPFVLQAMALQQLQHPYVCGYKEFFVLWDKEVCENAGCR